MQCTAYTPPPPLKLSHRYATEVDFQIYEMGPLAYYMADDFFIPNPPLGRIIGNIYRPPYISRDNYATLTREFNALLLEYHSKRYNTYMCGDYNIDLLKVNKVHSYDMYFNDVLSAGYIPTITLPTRLSTSSTLIDNIFTANISKEVKACI